MFFLSPDAERLSIAVEIVSPAWESWLLDLEQPPATTPLRSIRKPGDGRLVAG